ncbi:ABC transporter substrate-binding protein [Photorhabdus laumondii subsp. laumondii]|uniref:Photorhabdus luminescens subsp. laumondii TTO1 complete genome segment 4/17 n=2 Tax=Photorhabdus laumondii subsp. laumondii TaxID=141679 RepID=Q7N7H5_PHOLL|nr:MULTISPECIES: siderophore ABC transporter substrate-binding protein [Photorhabdus]AWK41064.1 iron ABC transporter substrate-binding protein [Photorhabdus laumondii subsp. laumondii]AXG41804.1 iron ABC transporter substrate-binding protein [Photorhabdus laumondii subsp. laumondii]AXG46392.1 iron ABC transporter substrate-binding protein [Photorhabdus laumondii subsp. laumondii]KTL62424.1 iron ABC transporter substrate-binding protein [Photorhabdus laumondii subsp. laumondii]MCC8386242.1 side
MKKIIPVVLVSLFAVASHSAFSQKSAVFTPNVVTAQADDKVIVKHLSGETEVKKNPQKVVSFDFGTYDSLVKLGLSDRVVALPTGNTPEYLRNSLPKEVENAGGMKEPNLEKLAQLKPDLIVITGRQGSFYENLSKIAPTINLGTDSKNYLVSVESNITLLGELFSKQSEVKDQIVELEKTIVKAQDKAKSADAKVLVLLHNADKLMLNNQSVVYDVVKAQKAELAIPAGEDKTKRVVVTSDMIAQANPDVILIIDRSEAIGAGKLDKAKFEDDKVKSTSAYKNGKITYLKSDLWYLSGGGLESLSAQVNAVADAL